MPPNRDLPRRFYVYILGSASGILYTGVTNDLRRRVAEHKSGQVPGFTAHYKVKRLLYVEQFDSILNAIEREKRIKSWTRAKRLALIRAMNPEFRDLTDPPVE
jgi:putative endonuclease